VSTHPGVEHQVDKFCGGSPQIDDILTEEEGCYEDAVSPYRSY
jgi:hypothetical protein